MRSSVTHLENLTIAESAPLSRRMETPPTEWVVHAVGGGSVDSAKLIWRRVLGVLLEHAEEARALAVAGDVEVLQIVAPISEAVGRSPSRRRRAWKGSRRAAVRARAYGRCRGRWGRCRGRRSNQEYDGTFYVDGKCHHNGTEYDKRTPQQQTQTHVDSVSAPG